MQHPSPAKQDGIALLVFIIIIVLATSSYFMAGISPDQIVIDKQAQTQRALKQAKSVLLAYAMNYPEIARNFATPVFDEGPGKLPCPDTDNDGTSDLGCNANLENPGRLPFDTLDVEDIRDGNNETLWYAVSENFGSAGATIINTSTTGTITVKDSAGNILHDAAGLDGVIAVIISPGETLVREDGLVQVRSTAAERDDPNNYLDIAFFNTPNEEDNAEFLNGDSNNGLISGQVTDAFGNVIVNDVIETITYRDMFEYIHPRVAGDIAAAINGFADPANCNRWPEATVFDPTRALDTFVEEAVDEGLLPVDDTDWEAGNCATGLLPPWVEAEEWHKNMYYAVAPTSPCTAAPPIAGADCLSSTGIVAGNPERDKQAVIVFSERHGLAAHVNDITQYYEGENATPGDGIYFDGEANDFLWVVAP